MRAQRTRPLHEWLDEVTAPNGLIVLSGYGIRVGVWRGRLRIEDGIAAHRRTALIHRATGRLKRLVVIGHTGSISLDAIRWLADIRASYQQVDADGRVLADFAPLGTDRARLRRAQATALDAPAGLEESRVGSSPRRSRDGETLDAVASLIPVDADKIAELAESQAAVGEARTPGELLLTEASAAAAYWSAWSPLPVRYAPSRRVKGAGALAHVRAQFPHP